jgi:hypothetical protein
MSCCQREGDEFDGLVLVYAVVLHEQRAIEQQAIEHQLVAHEQVTREQEHR